MKIALVVPHIFMQDALLESVIFSPAKLAINLAEGLAANGQEVDLHTPGPVKTSVNNLNADLTEFEAELTTRGYGYVELLKKHPLTFATLSRQVQASLIARVYAMANADQYDLVHIYTNEEDIGLQFAQLCKKPVVFTHHDPYNLTIGYKRLFPYQKDLKLIAMSEAQKKGMPADTNWLATIHHGLPKTQFVAGDGSGGYLAYLGRIIESKGVHHAIAAVQRYNQSNPPVTLKLAGKYYQEGYFEQHIEPHLNEQIQYVGFLRTPDEIQDFLGNAKATLMPSLFEEPFGMTAIESLACATPVIGSNTGALPEIIEDGVSGFVVDASKNLSGQLATSINKLSKLKRAGCRQRFEDTFTIERMVTDHIAAYKKAIKPPTAP